MGFFSMFKSASYETMENKGDALLQAGEFGPAKQAYEKALSKLGKSDPAGLSQHLERINKKIMQSKEALARQHKATAEDLIEAGWANDAVDLLKLALELTSHPDLADEIGALLTHCRSTGRFAAHEIDPGDMLPEGEGSPESGAAYFSVLCAALPEDLKQDYEQYGHSFEMGYVALNQGSFDIAVEYFSEAITEQGDEVTHIHLEMATAYLNLGDIDKSHALLKAYVNEYPFTVRAYELLCEIYWEMNDFKQAEELVANCPDDIKTSIPMMLLMGESLSKAGNLTAAESFYQNSIRYTGWSESIATALAKTYEDLDLPEKALKIYGEIMSACKSCRQQVNPFVTQRYAELSFGSGDISSGILELFFSLCEQDPRHRPHYFRRISEIYTRQGYHEEAKRYLNFAEADEAEPE